MIPDAKRLPVGWILQVRYFKREGTLGIMDAEEKSKGVKENVLGEVGKS